MRTGKKTETKISNHLTTRHKSEPDLAHFSSRPLVAADLQELDDVLGVAAEDLLLDFVEVDPPEFAGVGDGARVQRLGNQKERLRLLEN